MPPIDLTDFAGRRWTAAKFSGRTVLVEFWATWCAPCREIAPDLHAFYSRHKNSVNVLSVSLDDKAAVVGPYLRNHPVPYAVAHGGPAWAKPWGVTQVPALVLVRNGRVISKWQGREAVLDALRSLEIEL